MSSRAPAAVPPYQMLSLPAPVEMLSWFATPAAPDVITSSPPPVWKTSMSVSPSRGQDIDPYTRSGKSLPT